MPGRCPAAHGFPRLPPRPRSARRAAAPARSPRSGPSPRAGCRLAGRDARPRPAPRFPRKAARSAPRAAARAGAAAGAARAPARAARRAGAAAAHRPRPKARLPAAAPAEGRDRASARGHRGAASRPRARPKGWRCGCPPKARSCRSRHARSFSCHSRSCPATPPRVAPELGDNPSRSGVAFSAGRASGQRGAGNMAVAWPTRRRGGRRQVTAARAWNSGRSHVPSRRIRASTSTARSMSPSSR